MAKRIGPEAKIISLFTALPEDSKRIVMDVLKAQTATPRKVSIPKSSAPSATRRSSRKLEEAAPTVSTEGGTENVGTASARYVPICAICNDVESGARHQIDSPDYHIFRTSIKQKGKPNGEDKVQGVTA